MGIVSQAAMITNVKGMRILRFDERLEPVRLLPCLCCVLATCTVHVRDGSA